MGKNKICGVYTIFCIVTKEYYVGCSTNVFARLNTHRSHLRKGIHTNPKIQSRFNKYGISCFEFSILDEYSKDVITSMEHYWVNVLDSKKNGFNSRPTNPYDEIKAGRILKKRIHSQATKEKISKTLKGRKNPEHSSFMKGNIHGAKKVISENGTIYDSINEAAKFYNVSRSTMRKIIRLGKGFRHI